jgi:vancomycin permeability regulator SanA
MGTAFRMNLKKCGITELFKSNKDQSPLKPRKFKLIHYIVLSIMTLMSLPIWARLGIYLSARGRVYANLNEAPKCRVALVLGCRVRANGKPSLSLRDRVGTAVKLYKKGTVEKLLMSGDNRTVYYNEPEKMRDYAMKLGVPEKDIVMDFAGRRTYDSVYRAQHIFGLNQVIIVSQGYHLDRAIFLSRHTGLKAYGVPGRWAGRMNDRLREYFACMGRL